MYALPLSIFILMLLTFAVNVGTSMLILYFKISQLLQLQPYHVKVLNTQQKIESLYLVLNIVYMIYTRFILTLSIILKYILF